MTIQYTGTTLSNSNENDGNDRHSDKSTPYERFGNGDLILRDELAIDRTLLANERTFLAYLRAGVTLMLAGVTVTGRNRVISRISENTALKRSAVGSVIMWEPSSD